MTDGSLSAPPNDQGGRFKGLRTTFILLTILVALIGVQQAVKHWLIMVQPGQIVLCVKGDNDDILPIREPGPHWCRGEVYSYFSERRVGGDISFRFKDGIPGSVNVDFIYTLPLEDEFAWDPAVMIHLTYGSQEKFEQEALQKATLMAVIKSFGRISSTTFLLAPRRVAPLISHTAELHIRGELMTENIYIEIKRMWMRGTSRIPIPMNPRRPLPRFMQPRMPQMPEIPIQHEARQYRI